MTFNFRQLISPQEFLAHNTPGINTPRMIKTAMNRQIHQEVHQKYEYCRATNNLHFFAKYYQCVPDFVVIRPDELGQAEAFNL